MCSENYGLARFNVGWTDKYGNLWLFGGAGYDSVSGGSFAYLNNLWEYKP
jgi:hypothetical protein